MAKKKWPQAIRKPKRASVGALFWKIEGMKSLLLCQKGLTLISKNRKFQIMSIFAKVTRVGIKLINEKINPNNENKQTINPAGISLIISPSSAWKSFIIIEEFLA